MASDVTGDVGSFGVADGADFAERTVAAHARLRWWREVASSPCFYGIYSGVRNLFGSASVSPDQALLNAERIIDLERAVGQYPRSPYRAGSSAGRGSCGSGTSSTGRSTSS